MIELGTLVKDVSQFLSKTPVGRDGVVHIDWKKLRLSGQKGLVDLIRRVSIPCCTGVA